MTVGYIVTRLPIPEGVTVTDDLCLVTLTHSHTDLPTDLPLDLPVGLELVARDDI